MRHLVIIDGGIAQTASRSSVASPERIVAKRKNMVFQVVNGTDVLPFAPVTSLIIDDPASGAVDARTPDAASGALLHRAGHISQRSAGNGLPITYIACTKPRYPVSAGSHEKVQVTPRVRFRPIEAGHNCIISAPDLVAAELLAIPQ